MGIVTMVSAKGSPGVSTTAVALALAWGRAGVERTVTLADVDVSGSAPTSTYQRHGLGDGRGLLAWAATKSPQHADAVRAQLVALDRAGCAALMPGLPDGSRAAVLSDRWEDLLLALRACTSSDERHDVILDVGRFGSQGEATPLVCGADLVVVVLRSSYDDVAFARALLSSLRSRVSSTTQLAALLVGERRPYGAREVSDALETPVVPVMAHDRRAASMLAEGILDGALLRSALLRSATAAAAAIQALLCGGPGQDAAPTLGVSVGLVDAVDRHHV